MLKIVTSDSFDFGMPAATLLPTYSRGIDRDFLVKRASPLTKEFLDLPAEKGKAFIHLISMGAMESVGYNRNADGFNETKKAFVIPHPKAGCSGVYEMKGGLQEFHPTFKKFGHVYANHRHDKVENAIGKVVAEHYNKDMHRGELVISVPEDSESWRDDLQKLAMDKSVDFSMAIKIPADVCSRCGNRAKTKASYCDCLKNHLGKMTKEGHYIGAINDEGIFFDISKVLRGADRIAQALQMKKVAGDGSSILGGAELAELWGMKETFSGAVHLGKLSIAKRLASLEKQAEERNLSSAGCSTHRLSDMDIRALQAAPLKETAAALVESKVLLGVKDFFKLAMGPKWAPQHEESLKDVEALLPRLYSGMSEPDLYECCSKTEYDVSPLGAPRYIAAAARKLAADFSVEESVVQRRTTSSILGGRKPLDHCIVKQAAVSPGIGEAAKEFAAYQISFALACPDSFTELMVVLGNRAGRAS